MAFSATGVGREGGFFMNRFKLVLSDFHIGAGRLLEDGEINPFEYFIFDARLIGFLDYYSSGEFRKAEVELILNGDFLNTLQVVVDDERPTEISEQKALKSTELIFKGHPELFDALKRFAAAPNHRITYLIGNHDPSLLFPAVQDDLKRRLGAELHFPGFSYSFDGIWVEHGQQYTPANRFDLGKLFVKTKSGEVVINLPWGSIWVIEYLNQIKKERVYIDRIQPFGRYLLLACLFDPFFALPAMARLMVFFVRERTRAEKLKRKSELKRTLEMLQGFSIIPALDRDARRILGRPGYHAVIFGHNHQPAFRRFGRDKLYVNTGTWNDIIHLDIQNLGRQRRMTYAFIDYPDNRKPRVRLKLWKGTHLTEEDVIF